MKPKPLNAVEVRRLASLLKRVAETGFPLPSPVFFGWIKAFYANSVELALVEHGNPIRIFVLQRPADDPFYGSMWHLPGCIVWPNEKLHQAVVRLAMTEIGLQIGNFRQIGFFERLSGDRENQCPRGHTNCFLFMAKTPPGWQPKRGMLVPFLTKDPENLIPEHRDYLTRIRGKLIY